MDMTISLSHHSVRTQESVLAIATNNSEISHSTIGNDKNGTKSTTTASPIQLSMLRSDMII